MLFRCHLEIPQKFLTGSLTFSSCIGPQTLCNQSCFCYIIQIELKNSNLQNINRKRDHFSLYWLDNGQKWDYNKDWAHERSYWGPSWLFKLIKTKCSSNTVHPIQNHSFCFSILTYSLVGERWHCLILVAFKAPFS